MKTPFHNRASRLDGHVGLSWPSWAVRWGRNFSPPSKEQNLYRCGARSYLNCRQRRQNGRRSTRRSRFDLSVRNRETQLIASQRTPTHRITENPNSSHLTRVRNHISHQYNAWFLGLGDGTLLGCCHAAVSGVRTASLCALEECMNVFKGETWFRQVTGALLGASAARVMSLIGEFPKERYLMAEVFYLLRCVQKMPPGGTSFQACYFLAFVVVRETKEARNLSGHLIDNTIKSVGRWISTATRILLFPHSALYDLEWNNCFCRSHCYSFYLSAQVSRCQEFSASIWMHRYISTRALSAA